MICHFQFHGLSGLLGLPVTPLSLHLAVGSGVSSASKISDVNNFSFDAPNTESRSSV